MKKKFASPLASFEYWEENTPNLEFLRQNRSGKMEVLTFREAGLEARRAATYLKNQDFPAQSKIAILSKNCDFWVLADLAIMMSGHVSVPIYPSLKDDSIKPIVEHSESVLVFAGKLDNFDGQKEAFSSIRTIGSDKYETPGEISWEQIMEQNEPLTDLTPGGSKDLISIIYTSGTTGMPKGVMHSIENFANATYDLNYNLNLVKNPKFFSYLPLSHIAERIGIENQAFLLGASITFADTLESFATNLEATQPDLFFAVPRIWAKFQEKIREGLPQKKLNTLLKVPFLNSILKKKIRQKLGLTNARYIVSGAAPLSVDLINWFGKLGIEILQAYGMTEDCVISHLNLPGSNRVGAVGQRTHGAEAKLSPEGEICIKNNSLMLGYYKLPEETAKVFDKDGYLRTGDVGEYDHDGFLFITGRAKDQFKTDKGKYISPGPIELELSKNSDIGQVCVVGMGIPQPLMLVIPSESGQNKSNDQISESLLNSILEINPGLEKHEKIEKAVVMKEDWTVENGLLTPTLKIKRSRVEKIHMPMYKAWFESEDRVIFE
jgi:long-chain acyl-CoA synthetase